MTGFGWIASLIIGGLVGWIAEIVMKMKMGLLLNIVLGIIGAALMNTLVFAAISFTPGGWIGQLILAAFGACILIAAVRLLHRWA